MGEIKVEKYLEHFKVDTDDIIKEDILKDLKNTINLYKKINRSLNKYRRSEKINCGLLLNYIVIFFKSFDRAFAFTFLLQRVSYKNVKILKTIFHYFGLIKLNENEIDEKFLKFILENTHYKNPTRVFRR